MELSPKDQKLLFGGRWKILTIFARKRALKRVNELVEEADQLLATYPPVDYNNFGVVTNSDALKADLLSWDKSVNELFGKVFKGQSSEVQAKYISIVGNNPYGEYLILRDILEKRRAYIIEFKEVL